MGTTTLAHTYRNPHQQALLAVERELDQSLQQIERLKARVTELREARKTLLPLVKNVTPEEATASLTASLPQLCLRVLSFSGPVPQTIPQIRDGLRVIGVEVGGKNPLAILHTTLGRLAERDYAEQVIQHPGVPIQYKITDLGKWALKI